MSKQNSKKKSGKFNMHQFTYKYRKALVGTISILLLLSMIAGVFAQFI